MGLKGNGVLCVYPREKNIKNMLFDPSQKRRRKSTNEFKQVSPVDGTVLRFGELKESRGMNEQVTGHSYSAPDLLGTNSPSHDKIDKSWLKISLDSPKLRESISASPMKGLYYCVIYLRPGDYHHIHSPADWNALVRRHFAGIWKQGFMALAADGATNIGSIEEQVYNPQGHGVKLEKGKEVGVFNMGSTVAVQAVPRITDSVESSNTTPQAAWQIAQPPASGTNPMDGAQKGWTLINQHHPALEMRRRAANAPGVIVGSTIIRLFHQVFFFYITNSTQLLFSVVCVFSIFFLKFPATSSI
ncbi:hypothetical protein IGI04_036255 [Brassica rapa subsp. trilocularis]|uniref:Phosphatidylserine decarboxylase n=1 Tax=Brassica rapa subsp. trilocularis TaxID=1813537 RepID=A0ABQ7LFS3_BRACM|nr:hypothetical protein IGI04_036255 [Brassica rapa subsp. trilocularis]